MAKFEIAESITARNEGLYANNLSDRGGETYAGIARNYWKTWKGWKVIDEIKSTYGTSAKIINQYAKNNQQLNQFISEFYKVNFWDVNSLDLIQDQQVANTVYDFGVNSGIGRASKFLQQGINNLTNPDISVDGQVGNITIQRVNSIKGCVLHTEYNSLRRNFYISIAKGNQSQFLKSWLSRLKNYK